MPTTDDVDTVDNSEFFRAQQVTFASAGDEIQEPTRVHGVYKNPLYLWDFSPNLTSSKVGQVQPQHHFPGTNDQIQHQSWSSPDPLFDDITEEGSLLSSMINGHSPTNPAPKGKLVTGQSSPVGAEVFPEPQDTTKATTPPNQDNRRHACSQCTSRFTTAKDLDRHVRTVHHKHNPGEEVLICHEKGCNRKGRPFSRKDNYLKHVRKVHGKGDTWTEKRSSSTDDIESVEPDDDLPTPPPLARETHPHPRLRRGKRKLDALGCDDLDDLSRGELVELVLEMRQKCRKLEEDLRADRKRQETREDMWLKAMLGKMNGK
ncbi:hypothetical protein QBC34DRAFT_394212 [Podospora aff. communis PSN243]|uniref:C2H2-type domain-containing protein n=1 Tax=Podospora aff. communis PSN243 TaxID=3040156 RepID=A0AAV9GYM1_9PEZI|nr:hypothetical protein QBC34DRAFT_394212 [Podospora aff. communis PSN243]